MSGSLTHPSTTHQPIPVEVTFRRANPDDVVLTGLHQEWLSATAGADHELGEFTAVLCAGAGLANPFLTIVVSRPGQPTITEWVDMRDLFSGRVNAILSEGGPHAHQ